jgi:hypothetical protein
VSAPAGLPGAPDVRLAPLRRDGGRPALRRRAAVGLAVLALAVLNVLVATGRIALPEAGSGARPSRQASPQSAGTEAERARAAPRAPEARPRPVRVVEPEHAAALFARHSWFVAPPPLPVVPVPPPAPPEPSAPPLPYTFVGSYAPAGDPPVFFLTRGDRVIEARVGDQVDGVYRFESAAADQLVFVYLPLDIHQNLATSVPR